MKQIDPTDIVTIRDFSVDTLKNIVEHLEVSTEFEHMVYREAELDAIWSITAFFLVNEPDSIGREAVRRLHDVAHEAHDLVAGNRPGDAARLLRNFL